MAQAWGWRIALAMFLVLLIAAGLLWASQTGSRTAPAADTAAPPHGGPVWHAALAWQVTLYLGLNSTIYYVAISWLPTILADQGVSASQAGSLHGALQLATAVPGIALGPMLRRMRDQRLPAAATALLSAIALVGLLVMPHLSLVWAVLFGLGTGAGFILGLAFIGLRTSNAAQAATLSGMAQCAGYLLAAAGPMAMGALHDLVASWTMPLVICAVLAVAMAWFGALAGRNLNISTAPRKEKP